VSEGKRGGVTEAAVVIVNYRTPQLVERCLSVISASTGELMLDTVVVDNGSNDETPDVVRAAHSHARVVPLPENRGFAAGVNAGFAATEAPFVIVLNPDTEPLPGSLELLVAHLRAHPSTAVVAPLLVHEDGSFQRNAHRRFPNLLTLFVDFCAPVGYALAHFPTFHPHELAEEQTMRGGRVSHVTGAAMAVRREAYDVLGPLDEGFFLYLEETEWQLRAARAGWSIEVLPDARVMHRLRGGDDPVTLPYDHYLPSVYRYMELNGRTAAAVDATLLGASLLSEAFLTVLGWVSPTSRPVAERRREGAARVTRFVRDRRRQGRMPGGAR
jgi:GT2 family glycosyltransferase